MKLTPQEVEQFRHVGYLNIEKRLIDDAHLTILREHYDALFAEKRDTIGEGLRNLAVVGESESDEDADRAEEMLQIMEMWQLDEEYRKLLYHDPLLDHRREFNRRRYPTISRSGSLQTRPSRW